MTKKPANPEISLTQPIKESFVLREIVIKEQLKPVISDNKGQWEKLFFKQRLQSQVRREKAQDAEQWA